MADPITEPGLQKLEKRTFEESDSFEVPPADIVAYNEMRSCADLFRMYREGILEIRPEFQREIVWQRPAQTRFIDSLVKQLPIPSMCFSLDYKEQQWQVIDGLQRMWSIIQFLNNGEWKLSRLEDIDPEISGKSGMEFRENPKLGKYLTRVENYTLPITVLRCDYSKPGHMDYLFAIFHRLNTGGAKLSNQEVRNCIYSGKLNDFLRNMDNQETWLKITGRSSSSGDRYRGQEQLLRFFAFHDEYKNYSGSLARFLNRYMMKHREPDMQFLRQKKDTFFETMAIASDTLLERFQDSRPGISVLEAALVGISLNLDRLQKLPKANLPKMFDSLLESPEFSDERLREGLSAKPRVLGRISTAERIFSGE